MITIGIDPSLTKTGVAFIETDGSIVKSYYSYGITPKSRDQDILDIKSICENVVNKINIYLKGKYPDKQDIEVAFEIPRRHKVTKIIQRGIADYGFYCGYLFRELQLSFNNIFLYRPETWTKKKSILQLTKNIERLFGTPKNDSGNDQKMALGVAHYHILKGLDG